MKKPNQKLQHDIARKRLLYFILACGSIASTIILTMLISDSDIEVATNVVGVLNLGAAVYFVHNLIYS